MEELKTIIGEKVILRPITREDTPRIVRWRNTPSVVKNFIFREPFTEEMHNRWLDTKVASGEVIQYIKTLLRITGAFLYISLQAPFAPRLCLTPVNVALLRLPSRGLAGNEKSIPY